MSYIATRNSDTKIPIARDYAVVVALLLIGASLFASFISQGDYLANWSNNFAIFDQEKHTVDDTKSAHTHSKSKPCVKFRAPQPNRKKCSGATSIAPANMRSRSKSDEDNAPPFSQLTTTLKFLQLAQIQRRYKILGKQYRTGNGLILSSRAAFWSIYAFAQRMRN